MSKINRAIYYGDGKIDNMKPGTFKVGDEVFNKAAVQQAVAEATASIKASFDAQCASADKLFDLVAAKDAEIAELRSMAVRDGNRLIDRGLENSNLRDELAAKEAEINELSESIGFRNQELNQKDAEIAELKALVSKLQTPRPGDDLAKGVCSECKAIGAAYKIGKETP